MIEIMAPVGCYESLAAAIQAGAGSVYFGIQGLNMRSASANNFTIEDLKNIADICRENNLNSYLTVNTVIYGEDLEKMRNIIDAASEAGITAIIASDVAALMYARGWDRADRKPRIEVLCPVCRCCGAGTRAEHESGEADTRADHCREHLWSEG